MNRKDFETLMSMPLSVCIHEQTKEEFWNSIKHCKEIANGVDFLNNIIIQGMSKRRIYHEDLNRY